MATTDGSRYDASRDAAMSWVRALAFNFAVFAWTAILGVIGLPLLLAPRSVTMRFGRFWASSVLSLLKVIVGLDHEIRGLDRIPRGGCIIAMKHQSAWDTLILPVVLRDPAPVLKRELLLLPIYGWYADRTDRDRPQGWWGRAAPYGSGGSVDRRLRTADRHLSGRNTGRTR